MAKPVKSDTEISREDQNQINAFSKYNTAHAEKKKEFAQKKELIDHLDDAGTELELYDEDKVRIRFGDCFFTVQVKEAETMMNKMQDEAKERLTTLQDNMDDLDKKMKKLKASLYAKFGNSINLEEE